MRVVPTPARERIPKVIARLDTTMVMPVRAREYLDLPTGRIKTGKRLGLDRAARAFLDRHSYLMHVTAPGREASESMRTRYMLSFFSHINPSYFAFYRVCVCVCVCCHPIYSGRQKGKINHTYKKTYYD